MNTSPESSIQSNNADENKNETISPEEYANTIIKSAQKNKANLLKQENMSDEEDLKKLAEMETFLDESDESNEIQYKYSKIIYDGIEEVGRTWKDHGGEWLVIKMVHRIIKDHSILQEYSEKDHNISTKWFQDGDKQYRMIITGERDDSCIKDKNFPTGVDKVKQSIEYRIEYKNLEDKNLPTVSLDFVQTKLDEWLNYEIPFHRKLKESKTE